jgi:hypothetical protein
MPPAVTAPELYEVSVPKDAPKELNGLRERALSNETKSLVRVVGAASPLGMYALTDYVIPKFTSLTAERPMDLLNTRKWEDRRAYFQMFEPFNNIGKVIASREARWGREATWTDMFRILKPSNEDTDSVRGLLMEWAAAMAIEDAIEHSNTQLVGRSSKINEDSSSNKYANADYFVTSANSSEELPIDFAVLNQAYQKLAKQDIATERLQGKAPSMFFLPFTEDCLVGQYFMARMQGKSKVVINGEVVNVHDLAKAVIFELTHENLEVRNKREDERDLTDTEYDILDEFRAIQDFKLYKLLTTPKPKEEKGKAKTEALRRLKGNADIDRRTGKKKDTIALENAF